MNPSLELLLGLFVFPVDCTFIYLLFVSSIVDCILVLNFVTYWFYSTY